MRGTAAPLEREGLVSAQALSLQNILQIQKPGSFRFPGSMVLPMRVYSLRPLEKSAFMDPEAREFFRLGRADTQPLLSRHRKMAAWYLAPNMTSKRRL